MATRILRHRKLLAEAIRFHRKKAKLTQEMLAERASLNPKYIGEVERGLKNISVDALIDVDAFGDAHVLLDVEVEAGWTFEISWWRQGC